MRGPLKMRDERNKPQPLDLNKWLRFKSSILTNRVLLPVPEF